MVSGISAPVAVSPAWAMVIVLVVGAVNVNVPPGGTVTVTVSVVGGFTTRLDTPVEAAKELGSVGMNSASTTSDPVVASVAVVLAKPLELTGTGLPISVLNA